VPASGWHRDKPHFDKVLGLSSVACRLRFRRNFAPSGTITLKCRASILYMRQVNPAPMEHSIHPSTRCDIRHIPHDGPVELIRIGFHSFQSPSRTETSPDGSRASDSGANMHLALEPAQRPPRQWRFEPTAILRRICLRHHLVEEAMNRATHSSRAVPRASWTSGASAKPKRTWTRRRPFGRRLRYQHWSGARTYMWEGNQSHDGGVAPFAFEPRVVGMSAPIFAFSSWRKVCQVKAS